MKKKKRSINFKISLPIVILILLGIFLLFKDLGVIKYIQLKEKDAQQDQEIDIYEKKKTQQENENEKLKNNNNEEIEIKVRKERTIKKESERVYKLEER